MSGIADHIIKAAEKRMSNAERLRLRGDKYLAAGKTSFAEACYQKSERNIAFATEELKRLPTWVRGVSVG